MLSKAKTRTDTVLWQFLQHLDYTICSIVAGSLQEPNQIQAGQGDVHCPRGSILWTGTVQAWQPWLTCCTAYNK